MTRQLLIHALSVASSHMAEHLPAAVDITGIDALEEPSLAPGEVRLLALYGAPERVTYSIEREHGRR